jgi:hypothetical protein
MTSGAQTRQGQFEEVSWGFHGILVGSRVFLPSRWMMLEKVLGVGVVRSWFYLADKASPRGARCGCSLPPAPSYGLQP